MAITLTAQAADKVRRLMADPSQQDATGLRIKVVGGGCSGLSYQLALEREPAEDDHVQESEGIRVFIDPKTYLFVNGTQVDYHETMMESGFSFQNPNATGSCGCGTSFSA